MPLKWDQSERSQFFRYKVTAVFVRGLFSEGVVEVRGSKLQIRCRLILLISEHPIQRGIRKECWHRIPGNGTEFLEIWPPPKKTAFSGGKTKKKLPKIFFWLRDTYKKYILQKNWAKTVNLAFSSGQSNLPPSYMGSQPPTRWSTQKYKYEWQRSSSWAINYNCAWRYKGSCGAVMLICCRAGWWLNVWLTLWTLNSCIYLDDIS